MAGLFSLKLQLRSNLKEHRPKQFQALKQENQLDSYLDQQANSVNDQLRALENQGFQPHEALDMLRDEIYFPTEEDVPNLGEARQPYTD